MKSAAGPGGSTVSPCLLVDDIEEQLKFLGVVFGARVHRRGDKVESTVWQVEAELGNAVLRIGRSHEGNARAASMLYVWTDDVDRTFDRAVKAGATLISEPTDRPGGQREAGFKDPQGNIWWIGMQARKLSNREVERKLADQRKQRL